MTRVWRVFASAVGGVVLAGSAGADLITHHGNGVGNGALFAAHLGSAPATEIIAETWRVPGLTGTTDLEFRFAFQDGGYRFSFGFFDRSVVTADPLLDRSGFATQALGAAVAVFDERTVAAGATAQRTVAAAADLGFYLIPNDSLDTVLLNTEWFIGSGRPQPLFSVAASNPGGLDQMLWFAAAGLDLLAFEDITRTGGSDADFNDLLITVRALPRSGGDEISDTGSGRLTAIPAPAIAVAALGAALLLAAALLQHRPRPEGR